MRSNVTAEAVVRSEIQMNAMSLIIQTVPTDMNQQELATAHIYGILRFSWFQSASIENGRCNPVSISSDFICIKAAYA